MNELLELIDAYASKSAEAASLAGTRQAHHASDRRREAAAIRTQIVAKLACAGDFTFEGEPAEALEYCPIDHMYLIEHPGTVQPGDWIEEDDPRLSIVRD